jgi:hypothetical protein
MMLEARSISVTRTESIIEMIQNVCGSVLGIDIGCSSTRSSSAICRLD